MNLWMRFITPVSLTFILFVGTGANAFASSGRTEPTAICSQHERGWTANERQTWEAVCRTGEAGDHGPQQPEESTLHTPVHAAFVEALLTKNRNRLAGAVLDDRLRRG